MVKAVTVKPRLGNPMQRMVETPAGTLNSIGLQNPGLDAFIAEKMHYLRQFDCPVIVNIAADRVEDFEALASGFIGAIIVQISCWGRSRVSRITVAAATGPDFRKSARVGGECWTRRRS